MSSRVYYSPLGFRGPRSQRGGVFHPRGHEPNPKVRFAGTDLGLHRRFEAGVQSYSKSPRSRPSKCRRSRARTSAGPAPNPSKESASRLRFETPSSKSIVDSTNILGFELTILGLAWETDNECVRSNNLPPELEHHASQSGQTVFCNARAGGEWSDICDLARGCLNLPVWLDVYYIPNQLGVEFCAFWWAS